jgi:hypothetical protein
MQNFSRYFNLIGISATTAALLACSSTPTDGKVVMKISEQAAHVEMNDLPAKTGDTVRIYRKHRGRHHTREEELGVGVLKESLNSQYYELELPKGNRVSEGDIVTRIE